MALPNLLQRYKQMLLPRGKQVASNTLSGLKALSQGSGVNDLIGGSVQNITNTPKAFVNFALGNKQKAQQQFALAQQGADRAFGSRINPQTGKFQFTGTGAPRVALTSAGTLMPGAKVASLLGGAIGGGFAAYNKSNIGAGVGQGVSLGLQSNTISGATNPYLAKFVPKSLGLFGSRGVPAALNIAQGYAVDRATGQPTTKESVGIDLAVGLLGGKGQFNTAVPRGETQLNQLKGLIPSLQNSNKPLGGLIAPAKSRLIAIEGGKQGRRADGTYDFKVKIPEYVGGKIKTVTAHFKTDPKNPNKLVRVGGNLENAYGGILGIQPQFDEEGKLTGVEFNPEIAIGGVLAAGGIKALKGRGLDSTSKSATNTLMEDSPRDIQTPSNRNSQGMLPHQPQLEQRRSQLTVDQSLGADLGRNGPGIHKQALLEGQNPESIGSLQELNSSSGILPQTVTPYFNSKHFNVSPEVKKIINGAVSSTKPAIEKIVGSKLTNKEVIEKANVSSRILNSAVTRDQTEAWESALLKTRQKLAALSQEGKVDQEYIDTLITLKSLGTDIGRKLQSFGIGADPQLVTSKQAILEAVTKVEKDTSKVLKAAQGVDFNDINQATEFYRKFVKPKPGEFLDLLRYNSMLSSPNTHINNLFSNYQGTGIVAPIEKTIEGGFDALWSVLRGQPRTRFAGEGAAYAKGYYSNFGKAVKSFTDVMRGKALMKNPDMRNIPLYAGGRGRKYENILQFPMKTLEAMDQAFTTLTGAGATSSLKYRQQKGIGLGMDVDKMASNEATKRLFRSELGENNGSALLDAIDIMANKVQSLKGSENKIVRIIAKYSLPFLRTPTNILKQGVEYTPFGISALPGSKDKTAQLAKIALGSSIGTAVALLVGGDRLTWAEPTGEKQKQAFRAAGLQPYAVKVGNRWISYSKLHPAISFNLALVAAIRNAEENRTLDEGQIETLLSGAAKWVNFFADQSYVKSIGDLVSASKGDVEGLAKIPANYFQQLVPFRALMGWVARLTDPYQRQVDPDGSFLEKQLGFLATQIPGISQTVPARLDQFGNPIENQNRALNAISPIRVTNENPEAKQDYSFLREKARLQRDKTQITKELKKEAKQNVTVPKAGATGDVIIPGKGLRKLDDIEKDRVSTYLAYGKGVKDDELANYYLGDIATMPTSSKYLKAERSSKLMSKLSTIGTDEKLSAEQKNFLRSLIAKEVGLKIEELDYYKIANNSVNLKTQYVLDTIPNLEGKDLYQQLVNWRKPVNGALILSDGVIDNLIQENLLTEAQGAALKKIDLDSEGKLKVPKPKKPKKPKKIKMPKLPKVKKVTIRKPKKVKLKTYKLKSVSLKTTKTKRLKQLTAR